MNNIYLFGLFTMILCFLAGTYTIVIANNFPSTVIGGFLILASIGTILSMRQTKGLNQIKRGKE